MGASRNYILSLWQVNVQQPRMTESFTKVITPYLFRTEKENVFSVRLHLTIETQGRVVR